MNIWDWLILILIAAAVIPGIRRIRKKGGSCSGSCADCSQQSQCRGK